MGRHSKFVTLTACAGPTIAAVAFAAGPAAAQGMPTVDMVIGNNFGHLPMFVGVEKGFFKKHGVDVRLRQDAPIPRAVQSAGRTLAMPVLGGLHHQYFRV
jgi:ABC-type nitrate/sulfonate/bicarbonate transport system substrate-binding protein